MITYKILHKPTGLYYTPNKGSGNLSTVGKIYNRKPDLSEGYYSEVTVQVFSNAKKVDQLRKKAKLLAKHFNLKPSHGYFHINRSYPVNLEDWEIITYDTEQKSESERIGCNEKFHVYLIKVGIRSCEYNHTDDVIFANIEYFKKCYKANLSAYKALLFFGDYLNGEYEF